MLAALKKGPSNRSHTYLIPIEIEKNSAKMLIYASFHIIQITHHT